MTPTEAALRAALEVSLEWLEGQALFQEVPNHSLMQRIRAALAAPPHGKDAGEESAYFGNMDPDDWNLSGALSEIDTLRAQRDALQARLTAAKGLLREADAALESEGRLELAMRITEFLNTPKDK